MSLWSVAEPRFGARLSTAAIKKPCPPKKKKKKAMPHPTPGLHAVFTLRSQQPSFPSPQPTPQRCQNGGVIFTDRVGKGAKAEAGAVQWRQLRLKYNEKAPPCQLCLKRTQQEINSAVCPAWRAGLHVSAWMKAGHMSRSCLKGAPVISRLKCLLWHGELRGQGCQLFFMGPGWAGTSRGKGQFGPGREPASGP